MHKDGNDMHLCRHLNLDFMLQLPCTHALFFLPHAYSGKLFPQFPGVFR